MLTGAAALDAYLGCRPPLCQAEVRHLIYYLI